MDANSVTAVCAAGIAVASLSVSIMEARAVRQHNRHSVRPLLELWTSPRSGGPAGIKLVNYGLGPGIITSSLVTLDGDPIGEWNKASADTVRESLPVRPSALTFHSRQAIPPGFDEFLLLLNDFDRVEHTWFAELIGQRIRMEIHYESLYGGDGFIAFLNATG